MSDEAQAEEAPDGDETAPETAEATLPAQPAGAELLAPRLLGTLRKVVPWLWVLAVLSSGFVSGVEVAVLVLAAGILTLIITLMWLSVQSLTGGAALGFEEALGMGAPSKAEEEKRSVLRALKDLEYERSVGKISPEDYAELLAKYRTEAKRLIQTVDEALAPARQEVEQVLAQRLARAGLSVEERKPAATEEES